MQYPRSHKLIRTSFRQKGLYVLDQLKVPDIYALSTDLLSFRLSRSSFDFYLWHSCLGYVSASRLQFLASTRVLGPLISCDISNCSGCKLEKFSCLSFYKGHVFCSYLSSILWSGLYWLILKNWIES